MAVLSAPARRIGRHCARLMAPSRCWCFSPAARQTSHSSWGQRRRLNACSLTRPIPAWDSTGPSAPPRPEDVHEAQAGLDPRPPHINHDALSDSTVDHRTIYHFYANGAWTLLEMPEP